MVAHLRKNPTTWTMLPFPMMDKSWLIIGFGYVIILHNFPRFMIIMWLYAFDELCVGSSNGYLMVIGWRLLQIDDSAWFGPVDPGRDECFLIHSCVHLISLMICVAFVGIWYDMICVCTFWPAFAAFALLVTPRVVGWHTNALVILVGRLEASQMFPSSWSGHLETMIILKPSLQAIISKNTIFKGYYSQICRVSSTDDLKIIEFIDF